MDVSVKQNRLLVYVLKFFVILAGQCGSVTKGEREKDTKGLGSWSGFDYRLRYSFFLTETVL